MHTLGNWTDWRGPSGGWLAAVGLWIRCCLRETGSWFPFEFSYGQHGRTAMREAGLVGGVWRIGRWVFGVLGCVGWVAWGAGVDGSTAGIVSSSQRSAPLVATPMPFTNAVPDAPWRVAVYAFEHGWSTDAPHGVPQLETNGRPARTAVRARIVSEDPADRGWFLIAARRATNAAGDVLRMQSSNWLSQRPGLLVTPGPVPGEPWNVLLEFSRNSFFRPDELVPLPPLVVAGPGENPIGWRTNVHGIQLELQSVRSASEPPNLILVEVVASEVPEGWNVTLAGVTDAEGVSCWHRPRGGSLNARRMTFEMRPTPGAGVVHATLAVHRSRMAMVTVEPTSAR